MATVPEQKTSWLDRPVLPSLNLNVEKTLYLVFIVLAIITRFWMLGARTMSHDESLHTYYAWNLYKGGGFSHTPLMHGPFKFLLNAFVYSLFGADDFTSRISTALFGVALVVLPYLLRRWLGRTGALATSFMLLISPSIWYHARYIRDEAFMLVWVVLLAWTIFGYLHAREHEPENTRGRGWRWLLLAAGLLAFMFITMEAAFIFVAIFGFFLIVALLVEFAQQADFWRGIVLKLALGLLGAVAIIGVVVVVQTVLLGAIGLGPGDPSPFPLNPQPIQPGQAIELSAQLQYALQLILGILRVTLSMLIPAALIGYGVYRWLKISWPAAVRESPAFDLIIVLGSLSLFMLAASVLPILNSIWQAVYHVPFVDVQFFADGNFPTTDVGLVLRIGAVAFGFIAVAIAMGWWWGSRRWLPLAALFVGIGVTFFTTVFTNGVGLGTGFVGSLGYWLVQQGVQRGTQPIYYYFVVTPIYEYFPMLIATIATVTYLVRGLRARRAGLGDARPYDQRLFVPFMLTWLIAAWLSFSYAGEKMPWLMVYLALPMVVLSGRFLGECLDQIDWRAIIAERQWLAGLLFAAAVVSGAWVLGNVQQTLGGLQTDALVAFSNWLDALIVFVIAVWALLRWLKPRPTIKVLWHMSALIGLIVLAALTTRTGWIWNFINYDSALEFGVYAHGGPGVKEAMKQIEEYSIRTTGGLDIRIAFDADASWPYYWYLRDYPNKYQISNQPSRTDLEAPLILSSAATWNTVDNVVRKTYTYWQSHRIWWPMEDYKVFAECPATEIDPATGQAVNVAAYDENGDGTIDAAEKARGQARCTNYSLRHIPEYLGTLWTWFTDSDKRSALMDIFLNRDYTHYDQIRGESHKPDNWPLVDDFRLYIKKDLTNLIWTEGVGGVLPTSETPVDPYAKGWRDIAAIQTWGTVGSAPGQFDSPHDIAIGPDGSIYVADGNNHRVDKFDKNGEFVATIGSPSGAVPNPPDGQFNEPWGVAVAPDGTLYVADTWNHRIQKFSADGRFIKAWGALGDTGGQANGNEGLFYGPRGIAVDANGRVLVADTGNKRVQIFDKDGNFISQFGGGGLDQGRLDEPVGIAADPKGDLVVADTWNGRIQVFDPNGSPLAAWDIDGWLDKDQVGKPYVAVDKDSRVYVADEVGKRVLIFDMTGKYLGGFGQYGTDEHGFVLPGGVAVDQDGNIYVVDTGAGRVLKFPPFVVQ